METKLNQLLADFVVEYHKLQTFHWYVKGKDFFTVHAKLEEYYDHVNENIDEVAEHILMLNMKPLASLQEFFKGIFNHRSTRRVCLFSRYFERSSERF